MAAIPSASPGSSVPGPSTPKRRNTSEGSSTSLRNSCEACASSKVKCSGDKPQCHRCEKRGFPCEYLEAKRAGRKPAASTSAGNNNGGSVSQPASESGPINESAVSLNTAYASPSRTVAESSSSWTGLTTFDRSLFPELSNINGLSSGLTPPFPLDMPALDTAAPTASMSTADSLFSSTIDDSLSTGLANLTGADLEANNNDFADLFSFPAPTPGTTGLATPVTRDSQSVQRSPTAAAPCYCLIQSLILLKRLTEMVSSTGSPGVAKNNENVIRTIQDVLQQNKVAIDTAIGMLNCAGRHDGYLLVIVCLIAFKALEHFATILPETTGHLGTQSRRHSVVSSSGPRPTAAGNVEGYRIEGGDWARQSSQAILSELHGVRRLIKALAVKLRIQATAVSSGGASSATTPENMDDFRPSSKEMSWFDFDPRLPISAQVYRQLEVDLERRVKTLSQQIIGRLRDF